MPDYCIWLAIFLAPTICEAQELSYYRSYMAVPELHNPAYNGRLECTNLTLTDKHQWLGIEDAPNQQIASANIRIESGRFNRHGLGIMLLNDRNGANKASGLSLAYAKHFMVKKSKGHWLGLGISANGFYRRLDRSNFMANDADDPVLAGDSFTATQFNAAGGLLYYGKKFETGLSFFQLIPNKSYIDQAYSTELLGIVHAQYHYYLVKTVRLIPGFAVRYENGQHTGVDLNLKYDVVGKYWAAISTRMYVGNYENFMNSVLLYFGYHFKNFMASYSADIGTTRLQRQNFGGHEISIGYRICEEDCGCTD